jgi:hypothetical protein
VSGAPNRVAVRSEWRLDSATLARVFRDETPPLTLSERYLMTPVAHLHTPLRPESTPERRQAEIRRGVTRLVCVLGADAGREYFDGLTWGDDAQPVVPTRKQLKLYRAALRRRILALYRAACPRAEVAVVFGPTEEYPEDELDHDDYSLDKEEIFEAIWAHAGDDAWNLLQAHAFDDALMDAPRSKRRRAGERAGRRAE